MLHKIEHGLKSKEDTQEHDSRPNNTPAARAIATILYTEASWTQTRISTTMNIPQSTIATFIKAAKRKAQDQGTDLLDHIIYEEAHRSGRPKALNAEEKELIIKAVTQSKKSRKMRSEEFSIHVDNDNNSALPLCIERVSTSTVEAVLYEQGYARRKLTWKPVLTPAQKVKRLAWAHQYHPDHFDWTLVIFTDETPCKVGLQRGFQRIWRKVDEAYVEDCLQARQKKYSEMQFWGCFTHGYKGPCHIWRKESEDEKALAITALSIENRLRQSLAEDMQSVATACLDVLGETSGNKRKNKKVSGDILKRNDRKRGGVDGYRHREHILKPLLLPFVEHVKERKGRQPVVMEDNAPAHSSKFDKEFMSLEKVVKMLWAANSPDANAIEHVWPWIRSHITKDFLPSTTEAQCEAQWRAEWDKLDIERINRWIENIPSVIRQIIAHGGGNDFYA